MAQAMARQRSVRMQQRTPAFRPITHAGKAPRVAPLRAAAAPAASDAATATAQKEWYGLVANAEFWVNDVQNEAVAEQLRERARFFKEQNRETDFYLVPEPVWLESRFPQDAKRVKRPCIALVSTDKQWITFMKLRLDRVLKFDLKDIPEAEILKVGGQLPKFKAPEKWTAPYSRYAEGWWEVFVPKN